MTAPLNPFDPFGGLIGPFGPCANSACVDAEPVYTGERLTGYRFFSTIEGNTGEVFYTVAEVAQFLDNVKGGEWDAVHDAARTAAEALTSA